jgi:hypothetical protein
MELTQGELAYVRNKGLYVTEECDGCGKVLNQSFRYTITGKPDVYCSAACRGFVFFGDRHEAKKHLTPKQCTYCGSQLKEKNRGTLYCDESCRMRANRTSNAAARIKLNNDLAESTGSRTPKGQVRQSPVLPTPA